MTDGYTPEKGDTDPLAMDAAELRASYPRYTGQAVRSVEVPARPARTVPAGEALPAELSVPLGFDLWSHQASALSHLADGENVCVATGTASGKTLVYALHAARTHLEDPASRTLIVYPTKALSRDQERELTGPFDRLGLDLSVGVYDGDTPAGEKRRVREEADVVVTNFVGLNQYLESHHLWAAFHADCSLIVVDEAHTWTGLSGMHAAWVLRRLRRLVGFYGGDPQYVLTTATVGNPAEHARALTGEDAAVVSEDGSPRGARHLVFWQPPASDGDGDDRAPNSRRPATVEAPEVWAHACANGVGSLLFCDSRKTTELAVDRARRYLREEGYGPTELASYNAGHGRESRRATEYQLKEGILDGVATTSALEVGIDVGGVDGTVLVGYPGSRNSFWQRLGRSGRGRRDALSVFVAGSATLDQYVLRNPEYVLESDHEDAVVDLGNNPVYLQHVRCAAQELPLTREDADLFGGEDRLERATAFGRRNGDLEGDLDGGVTYAHRDRPQDAVSLYASGGSAFDVRLADGTDGDLDHQPIGRDRAYRDYHEGATVLYRGDQYQVVELREDVPQPYVALEPVDLDYYTQSQGQVGIDEVESERSREVGPFTLHWGYGTVTVHYRTYRKSEIGTGEPVESGLPTGVPPLEMRTELCWATVPEDVERALLERHADYTNERCTATPTPLHGYLGGIHAVEHAMIAVAPLELQVADADLGGLATYRLPGTPDASGWFLYDGVEGGLGFSRSVYESFEAVAGRALELVTGCPCGRDEGCPACTMDDRCGNDNRPLYSPAAADTLRALLGETDAAALAPDRADRDGLPDRRPSASIS
jgi:DEAD/DEAH box helicase domain-containing protein